MDLAVPHCLAPSRVDCAELHRTVCDPIRSAPSCAVSRCAALRSLRAVLVWSVPAPRRTRAEPCCAVCVLVLCRAVPTAHRASTESRRSRAEPSRSRLVLACVVFAPNCTALCWSELRWSGLVSSWFGPHRSDLHCADPRRAATRRAEPSR
jgi:hypothetical protein